MKNIVIIRSLGTSNEVVSTALDMTSYYMDFINAIPIDSKDREDRFKNGVACIVWGAFYLESVINETVLMILEDGTNELLCGKEVVWPLLEKVKTEQKLELILDVLMKDGAKKLAYSKSAAAIFKLRNRLAHYKESPKEVEPWRLRPSHPLEDNVQAQFRAARMVIPNIVNDVLSATVEERRAKILEIGGWVKYALFEYYKCKKPPVSSK